MSDFTQALQALETLRCPDCKGEGHNHMLRQGCMTCGGTGLNKQAFSSPTIWQLVSWLAINHDPTLNELAHRKVDEIKNSPRSKN